jgi:hypothetical protein
VVDCRTSLSSVWPLAPSSADHIGQKLAYAHYEDRPAIDSKNEARRLTANIAKLLDGKLSQKGSPKQGRRLGLLSCRLTLGWVVGYGGTARPSTTQHHTTQHQ